MEFNLRPRYIDMVRGTAVNVTQKEFSDALREARNMGRFADGTMLRNHYPELDKAVGEEVRGRAFCKLWGINPDEHELKMGTYFGCDCALIDGYWSMAFLYLFTDGPEKISIKTLRRVKNYLIEKGDDDALVLLYTKYRSTFAQIEKEFREQYGLDENIKLESFSQTKINGMNIKLWLALNCDNYTTSINALTNWIHKFEANGDTEKAEILRNKYKELLGLNDVPSMKHTEAQSFRDYILSPEYRKKLIERNKERCKENADNN